MTNRKLLDQVSRTEETYRNWIKRYIFFHGKRHPKDLNAEHVRTFLTHLAVNEHVAASTQNQDFFIDKSCRWNCRIFKAWSERVINPVR